MKNNPILNLSKLAMIIVAILMQISCQQDEVPLLSADFTLVNLSVSASNSGTTVTADNSASTIKSLCILQFNANGTDFGTLRHVGIGTETSLNSGSYSATLLQSVNADDRYKLVILANLLDYTIFHGMAGKSYAEVQQACLSQELSGESNVPAFDATHPFPMFGIVNDGDPLEISEGMTLGSVSLVRALARVDIGVGTKDADTDTWTKGPVKFNLTQIQIWKAGKQYAYMPAKDNFSSASGALTINTPSPVGSTETKTYTGTDIITNSTYCSEKIYLPEAALQWGDVYDDNHTNRLAIIVGGKYNGSQTETFYRVDFTYDEGSKDKMNVLRNHIYQFTISKVEASGYATAELAYNSKPKNLNFNATIERWYVEQPTSVPSILGYYLSYQGFNGEYVDWSYAADQSMTIPRKNNGYWPNTSYLFDYNNFYKEGNSYYSPNIAGGQNGSLYATVPEALGIEGTFHNLMVSGDDMTDESASENIPWKTGTTLTAFDLCRNLEENGFNDWRLPRLSELAFIYVNQESLKQLRGFTPLNGNYWCGSEYLVPNATDDQKKKSDSAWAVDFTTGFASSYRKTETLKIRCVRQKLDDK